jgi:hypothetical protein
MFYVAASATGGQPVRLFLEPDGSAGKIHALTFEDQNIHPMDGFFYNEAWFMIAISDNDYYGYVTFVVSNSGMTAMTPGFSFTIVTPERERLVRDVDFKPEDLEMSDDRFELKLKDAYFRETGDGYDLKVSQGDMGIDISFKNQVPGFVLGDGNAVFGENNFYINYPGPRPTFTGTFTVGGREIPVSGWGYIDHSITSSNPSDYQRVWHNFKFRSDTHTVLISSFTTPDAYDGDFGFGVVTDTDKILCSYTDVKVTESDVVTDAESGKPYPHKVSYVATGESCRVRASIDTSRPAEKFDVLAKLDQRWWGKAVKVAINTFIAEPWYFRAVEPVEVEVTVDGKTFIVKGRAFNEIIFTE